MKKLILKSQQTTRKHEKLPSIQRANCKNLLLTPKLCISLKMLPQFASNDIVSLRNHIRPDLELSGSVVECSLLDSRPRGCWFKPHCHHCSVSLSKTH